MTWLDRQGFLGHGSEALLAALTVGIVGLGGGGSHVAQQLAHVGVGGFVLADDDRIDGTNLNRLVGGTRGDVRLGARKVDIAARLILGVNPDARIALADSKWQAAGELLAGCDVVFGCVDNVRGKAELEAFCRRLLIPYVDQGMDVHETGRSFLIAGQVVLSMPGGPCLRCLGVVTDDALDEEGRNYGAAGGKPQVVWPNGVLASTAVGLFMRTVTPWHDVTDLGACLEYDGNEHTMRQSERFVRMRGRPCPHHLADALGDPLFDVRRLGPVQSEGGANHGTASEPAGNGTWWRRLLRRVQAVLG